MKLELFKKRILERRQLEVITPVESQRYILKRIMELKGILKYVDFDCQIKEDGQCKRDWGARCCCSNCDYKIGFLDIIPENLIPVYAKKFSKNTGFWRSGKGCILDHKLRATICLTHHCNHDDQQFATSIRRIRHMLQDQQERILDIEKEQ